MSNIKLTEESIEKVYMILGLEVKFQMMTSKAQSVRGNKAELDFINIKNLCSVKDTIKRMKRLITNWERIFANHIYIIENVYPE